ncbi:MAG TPA: Rrf2 family transcriptional regulator [Gemmatimonadaceae bacterium]|nr:Rrf2 family transcriptional regulator [Gemmatimonadaceae bacterium]
MLTKTADYALRALLVLARRGPGRSLAADAIAEMTGTPRNYTGKTLYALSKAGLVKGTRGPTGGFTLAKPAEEITIAAIADVFAEAPLWPLCLLGAEPCNPERPCPVHHRWTRVVHAAREPLMTTTIADLIGEMNGGDAPPAASPTNLAPGSAGPY